LYGPGVVNDRAIFTLRFVETQPELIYAPIDGGTIHRYEISGGKRKFLRFIGCYLGQCNFHKNVDDAIDYIKNLKESQKIQKT
jgi:hypothetical protein